ncbi:MAG: hypothetical protein V3R81_06145 [Gammaproteobacteria bacterium]
MRQNKPVGDRSGVINGLRSLDNTDAMATYRVRLIPDKAAHVERIN